MKETRSNSLALKFLSLFSGIGGFDLGFERAGMICIGQVEIDPLCRSVLEKNWPAVLRLADVKTLRGNEFGAVDVICGGDPCPCRSQARSNRRTIHPDLSGYFLSIIGRIRPSWVVRENVPAPDDVDFTAALEAIGYRAAIIGTNAEAYTAQSRQRDFIVGCVEASWLREFIELSIFENGPNTYSTRFGTRQVTPALTTHRTRYDSRDCYIWDGRLRIPDNNERQILAGFPDEWLSGLSEATVARMCGNAVVPGIAEVIGKAIILSMHSGSGIINLEAKGEYARDGQRNP